MKKLQLEKGFTLIETIIYIGLFGIMCTGIFVSMYPLFTSAQRLTSNILIDSETAFILAKIEYALYNGITSPSATISSPSLGSSGSMLTITNGTQLYQFKADASGTFCTAPIACKMLTLALGSNNSFPLNSQRVHIENFVVTHNAPSATALRSLDISFTTNGVAVGPIRYYIHFKYEHTYLIKWLYCTPLNTYHVDSITCDNSFPCTIWYCKPILHFRP